jgi:HD domain
MPTTSKAVTLEHESPIQPMSAKVCASMDRRVVTPDDLRRAREVLAELYEAERAIPGSPVNHELIQLNLEHTDRVQRAVQAIAEGEGLDAALLELAAVLHDVAKLDHRDTTSGGIDTWHHHHRGASAARKIVLADLGKTGSVADSIAAMIERHSDIPFIRRYWQNVYAALLPSPRTPEEFALRDADVIDMLWVGGLGKIVFFRQIPGSDFYSEDGGDIQKAIASARTSFIEAAEVLVFPTARALAAPRIATVEAFCAELTSVASLDEFSQAYHAFLKRLEASRLQTGSATS